MNKKGFTLVEMLGVVTILAIISIIVIPMVINQIRNRQTQINKAVIETISAASEEYKNKNKKLFYGQINSCIKISNLVDSDLLDSTIYDYDELGVDLKDAYVLTKSYNKEASISLSCSPIFNTYNNGTAIYFNPEIGNVCSNPVSRTGVKSGCMKWYVFNDDDNSSTVSVILDHNTTPVIGASDINSTLANDISSWFVDIRSTARLITADEIAKITGADEVLEWDSTKTYISTIPTIGTNISGFYFDGANGSDETWKSMVATAKGASKYAWLYDYTYCLDGSNYKGCNIADTKNDYTISTFENVYIQGYWTSTSVTGEMSKTWKVDMYGSLIAGENDQIFKNGIRPVIEIPKSSIK